MTATVPNPVAAMVANTTPLRSIFFLLFDEVVKNTAEIKTDKAASNA